MKGKIISGIVLVTALMGTVKDVKSMTIMLPQVNPPLVVQSVNFGLSTSTTCTVPGTFTQAGNQVTISLGNRPWNYISYNRVQIVFTNQIMWDSLPAVGKISYGQTMTINASAAKQSTIAALNAQIASLNTQIASIAPQIQSTQNSAQIASLQSRLNAVNGLLAGYSKTTPAAIIAAATSEKSQLQNQIAALQQVPNPAYVSAKSQLSALQSQLAAVTSLPY